jgi:hypothetical protein
VDNPRCCKYNLAKWQILWKSKAAADPQITWENLRKSRQKPDKGFIPGFPFSSGGHPIWSRQSLVIYILI